MKRAASFSLCALLLASAAGYGAAANADTISGTFSNIVVSGNVLNDPTVGSTTYMNNAGTTVTGTSTPGGSACASSSTLCWGTDPDAGIATADQYSELVFSGSTTFDHTKSGNQTVGSISFLNGTSALDSLIFGATLNIYDDNAFVGSYDVIINTTSNQYSGTGLTASELATDADYINICGNDSNICNNSIEAYEDSEGGTGLDVTLTGKLVGDPTLVLDGVTVSKSDKDCTTCGVVGNEAPLAATPEPSASLLLATALVGLIGLSGRKSMRNLLTTRS